MTLTIEWKPCSMIIIKWQSERTKVRHVYYWPYNLKYYDLAEEVGDGELKRAERQSLSYNREIFQEKRLREQ